MWAASEVREGDGTLVAEGDGARCRPGERLGGRPGGRCGVTSPGDAGAAPLRGRPAAGGGDSVYFSPHSLTPQTLFQFYF